MKEEIKERWVSKLTSGEYPQTKNNLHDENGYCCLGVLCEVAVEDGVVIRTFDEGVGRYVYTSKIDPSDNEPSVLPHAVVKWSGLDDTNPEVSVPDDNEFDESDTECLAVLNDNGYSFPQIAQLIEESL